MNFKGVEICCPHCQGDLQGAEVEEGYLHCVACRRRFPVLFGIPDLRVFSDPYIELEADRAKGLRLAAQYDTLSFAELVALYYRMTPDVPPYQAQRYTRGLMAGVSRATEALAVWEEYATTKGRPASALLEIGCGTGPLLVAAAGRFRHLVGVDIAFRWLVIAKKRLAEAGLDVPLICACAEALPFPDNAFDRIVADSVLEHVRDQHQTLVECHRILRLSGYLFIATPNRYSLGPDPHVGLWLGGVLPETWVAAYARWRGGRRPQRRLLSARSLSQLIQATGYGRPLIFPPAISMDQRRSFGPAMQRLIDLYLLARRLPVSRQALPWLGPLLHAVVEKGPAS